MAHVSLVAQPRNGDLSVRAERREKGGLVASRHLLLVLHYGNDGGLWGSQASPQEIENRCHLHRLLGIDTEWDRDCCRCERHNPSFESISPMMTRIRPAITAMKFKLGFWLVSETNGGRSFFLSHMKPNKDEVPRAIL